jgi:hypothetical protein
MRKLTLTLLAPALLWIGTQAEAAPQQPDTTRLFSEIESILNELSRITGLKPLKKVESAVITRDRVKDFLGERLKEELTPEDVHAEELVLKKFGFVPQDFDLAKSTIDLFTEQAAAFYDFRKKKLYVLDSTPGELQKVALVHELAHALADQHFHLDKYIRHGASSDDSSLARLAVMEGQAAWLMSEYTARQQGQSLGNSDTLVETMRRATETSAGSFPVFEAAPLYMRETMLFPYTQGLVFQQAVYRKLGQAGFAEVFKRPPSSVQQVLHPEKYFAHAEPTNPAPPVPADEKSYKMLIDGSVGEFDHAILLRQYVGQREADEISPEWRGGIFKVWESKDRRHAVLGYASDWASAESARRFFRLYRRILESKWKHFEVATLAPDRVTGRGDDGYFVLRLEGSRVTSLEGLPQAVSVMAVR